MTSTDLTFFMTSLLDAAGMAVCAISAASLFCERRFERRVHAALGCEENAPIGSRHWPLYTAALVTALAYGVRLALPDVWTPPVYNALEALVATLALFVGDAWWIALRKPVGGVILFLFAALATGAPLLALDGDACGPAYVLLGIASMIAAILVYECHPRDEVEKIARLGLSALLAFQGARGMLAFAACEEPVLMAMLSGAGWAVHVTAFGLIAWAARRG